MSDLSTLHSKIKNEIEIFVKALQKEIPEKEYAFIANPTNTSWLIKWKSTNYLDEYCELEIWEINKTYFAMETYVTDDTFQKQNEDLFYYKIKTLNELLVTVDSILHEFKKEVSAVSKK